MIIEVKEYRAARGSDVAKHKCGTTELAGKLTLTAQCDTDAMQIAAIAWAIASPKDKAFIKFRERAISMFCKKHNMHVTVNR